VSTQHHTGGRDQEAWNDDTFMPHQLIEFDLPRINHALEENIPLKICITLNQSDVERGFLL